MSMMRRRGLLLAAAVALLAAAPARAGCTGSTSIGSFGSIGSRAVASTVQTTTSGSGIACTGSLLGVLSTNTVTAQISSVGHSSGTALFLKNEANADRIGFILCQDAACGATYGVGSTISWSNRSVIGLLGLFNASDGTLPLTLRTIAGSNVSAGTYSTSIAINWAYQLCSVGVGNGCLVYENGNTASQVTISLIVQKDCEVIAPPLSFGSAAFVTSFNAVTQAITVRCTKDADYTVGISEGGHLANGVRNMAFRPPGETQDRLIPYDIFFPAGSQNRWGPLGAQRRGNRQATTNGETRNGTTAQTFTYRAQILPQAIAVPAGRYVDTLVVDVAF